MRLHCMAVSGMTDWPKHGSFDILPRIRGQNESGNESNSFVVEKKQIESSSAYLFACFLLLMELECRQSNNIATILKDSVTQSACT
jgi:hypothetical protein